MTIYNIT